MSPIHANPAMSTSTRSPSVATSGASSIKSSAFSESTRLQVKEIDGDTCWACGTESPHICHVVAQEDRQAPLWSELGLIDFPIDSYLNAVPLCPTCDTQFDCSIDPGLVLMPVDLDFFIEFEIMDRDRRKKAAEAGLPSKRKAPTFEQYKQHQVEQGIITADAIGGRYLPIFLKSYLHCDRLAFDITEALTKPMEWHGAPMACIRRCIHALGSPRLGMRNPTAHLKLLQLYKLYFYDNDNSSPLSNTLSDQATQSGKKRQYGDSTGEPHSKRHQGPQGDGGSSSQETTFCPTLQREVRAYWTLGPDVSAEEAVRQFAPILTRSLKTTHA